MGNHNSQVTRQRKLEKRMIKTSGQGHHHEIIQERDGKAKKLITEKRPGIKMPTKPEKKRKAETLTFL